MYIYPLWNTYKDNLSTVKINKENGTRTGTTSQEYINRWVLILEQNFYHLQWPSRRIEFRCNSWLQIKSISPIQFRYFNQDKLLAFCISWLVGYLNYWVNSVMFILQSVGLKMFFSKSELHGSGEFKSRTCWINYFVTGSSLP